MFVEIKGKSYVPCGIMGCQIMLKQSKGVGGKRSTDRSAVIEMVLPLPPLGIDSAASSAASEQA